MIDRASILRTAHARVRHLRARFHWRTYRELLAEQMRRAWADAKARASIEAVKPVEIRLTAGQRAEIERLEDLAQWQPITRLGNEHCAALRLQASLIRNAAVRAATEARP